MSKTIVVTGGTSGLGASILKAVGRDGTFDNRVSLALGPDAEEEMTSGVTYMHCDVRDGNDITLAADRIERAFGDIDVLVNCAGINRIGYLDQFEESDWDAVMDTNAKSMFLTAKAFVDQLARSMGTILNVVSNASHMPMTASLAYNASKGAGHIMTLQLARELTKSMGITVFGLSPAKLAGTQMSRDIDRQVVEVRGWTPEYARQYQLNGLVTGEEIPPYTIGEFVAFLLSNKERHKHLSGCVLPYGA